MLDTVELKPIEGGDCTSSAPGTPPPPMSVEVYFGNDVPPTACPEGDCTVLLDDGTGFATGRGDAGLDYGWDCDGDTNVDSPADGVAWTVTMDWASTTSTGMGNAQAQSTGRSLYPTASTLRR